MPDMPPVLQHAAVIIQTIMVAFLLGMALAVVFEPPEGLGTTNYYVRLFHLSPVFLPTLLVVLAGYGIYAMRVWRRNRMVGALVMALCGLPYLAYGFGSTYYLKVVIVSVSNVPIALYWTGIALYYASLIFLIGLGVWSEQLRMAWRWHR